MTFKRKKEAKEMKHTTLPSCAAMAWLFKKASAR
jgi:hypothetical protein